MNGGFSLYYFYYLLQGMGWTIVLSAIAFVAGGAAGFLVMLARISHSALLRRLVFVYVQIVQGTPLLIILFVVYFGLGIFGIEMPPLFAAGLSMMIYCSAFLGEIWRGCIQAIPRGQWEAADALALGHLRQLRFVILPQALRIAIPPTVGFLVQVLKGTSLASIIGFTELTRAAQVVNNATFRPFLVYATVTLLYFALCWPLSWWSQRLERRLDHDRLQVVGAQI
jgi:polar amino acid transport system permease protein